MEKLNDVEFKEFLKEEEDKAVILLPSGGKIRSLRAAPKDVDYYRKLPFPELLDDFLNKYFWIKILQCFSVRDCQLAIIMEREVNEFRSKSEQKELKNKVKKLKEADHSALLKRG